MAKNSKISWCDNTWNPVTGCTKVSPGCDNCYAFTLAERKRGTAAFPRGFDVMLRPPHTQVPTQVEKAIPNLRQFNVRSVPPAHPG